MGHLAPGRTVAGQHGTYRIEKALTSAGFARAFAAERDGEPVLLKEVHIGDPDAWTRIDALVAEARATAHLAHPRIPTFLELFVFDGEQTRSPEALSRDTAPPDKASPDSHSADKASPDTSRLPSLVLARKLLPGTSLAAAIRGGRRFVVADLERMLRGLLEIRRHLDALLPPLIHGDIGPHTVLLDDQCEPSLIDFGATSDSPEDPLTTSAGSAESLASPPMVPPPWPPAADIESIAWTVLSAASHLPPARMPRLTPDGPVDIARTAPLLPPHLTRTLRACFEPDIASHPRAAELLLRRLDERFPRAHRTLERARRALLPRRARVLLGGAISGALLTAFYVVVRTTSALQEPLSAAPESPDSLPETPVFGTIPVTTAEPLPLVEPAPPDPPPAEPAEHTTPDTETRHLLRWTGVVERATGATARTGDSCLLTLAVGPSVNPPLCTIDLTCGDRIILEREPTNDCRLQEIAAGDALVYRAAFWYGSTSEQAYAMDGTTGQFHQSAWDPDGNLVRSLRVKFAERSLPSTDGAFLDYVTPAVATTYRGTVVDTRGKPGAKRGQDCTYRIGPNPEYDIGTGLVERCRATVECGSRTLYDGHVACGVPSSDPESAMGDDSPSVMDGDPRLFFDAHMLTVADIEPRGAWQVSIYLEKEPAE